MYTLAELRNIPIFFIVGKGRSGTTLLSTILDSHPEVASATESRFLLMLWQKYKHQKTWNSTNAQQFVDDLMVDLRIQNLWEFNDELKDNLAALPPETTIQDLIKLVYLQRKSSFPKGKIKIIVDKNPMYTLLVDRLIHIFPEAKFYRLIRDPRDNITSHLKYSKNGSGMLAYKWLNFNKKLDRFGEKHPTQLKTQRFEDLILNNALFFEEFESYFGIKRLLEVESKRLAYKDKIEEKLNDRLKDQHQASVKPLDPTKVGHYKQKLKAAQIHRIEAICFPYAQKYHYELPEKQSTVGTMELTKWRFKNFYRDLASVFFYSIPFFMMKMISDRMIKKINYTEKNETSLS